MESIAAPAAADAAAPDAAAELRGSKAVLPPIPSADVAGRKASMMTTKSLKSAKTVSREVMDSKPSTNRRRSSVASVKSGKDKKTPKRSAKRKSQAAPAEDAAKVKVAGEGDASPEGAAAGFADAADAADQAGEGTAAYEAGGENSGAQPTDEPQASQLPEELERRYREAERPKVIARFKDYITLSAYSPDMWTTEHQNTLSEYLVHESCHKLFAYVHDNKFHLQTSVPVGVATSGSSPNLPGAHVDQFMYFIRDSSFSGDIVTEADLENSTQYGTICGSGSSTLESLLRLMHGVYVPMFLENRRWPDSVRKEFSGQLHKFMAHLTDTTYQLKGCTILYVPNEEYTAESVKSKDVVQRLEALLVHWTRQIKEVVNNQHTSETAENSGPLEEIQFWRSRCDDLSGIDQQLKRKDVQHIIAILQSAKSSYLEQFTRLSTLIQEGSLQAQDNLKFLSTLVDSCKALSAAEPKDIPPLLPKLLHCVRIIWANSRYYNTRERLTSLLRKVSNEIIRRCCVKISLDDVFNGDVEASMFSLQDSISCGEAWKAVYIKTCAHVAKFTKANWDFDQSSIFAQIDAFVQRCRDLLEVCEGQIQFARKTQGGKKAPIPVFGGSRGPEIGKSLEEIDAAFERQIQILWSIRKHILDVKATRWHDDYNHFKQGVKDLEVMMQNVITSAFEGATTMASNIELLEIFHHLAKREAIKRTVEKKTADVYSLFLQELNAVKIEFEAHRKMPELLRFHPDYAGASHWARSLVRRISSSMNLLKNAYYLPSTALLAEATAQYEPLISALEDYMAKTHAEWISSLGNTKFETRLEIPLMARRPGELKLEMRFDKDLLRLFAEIHYFAKLKYDIPFHIQEIYSKNEEMRVLRENVLLVIRDYNNIIETLTPEEHLLFRELIRFLDRKINPGLTNLTWASKGITEYFVKECRRHSHDVQCTVRDFTESNLRTQRNCKAIADTLLWHVEPKRIYELAEFEAAQEHHRASVKEKLSALHGDIRQTLQATYEVFRNDGREVQGHWVRYVEKIDNLVQESLRATVKRSLQEISKAINGEGKNRDGTAEVHPLFKVNVTLEAQKVEFVPSLQELEEVVNRISRELVSTIAIIPRLAGTLAEAPSRTAPRMVDIIVGEDDILKIFVNIANGMANNATNCQAYVRNWDSYREIWEINKDAFIRRYAKLKPAMSTFDADIARYNEVANNTQKEEMLTNINFVRLDCSPLKHALVSHCSAWQNKLTTLLNSNASTDLNSLHEMFRKKTKQLQTPPANLDQLSDSLNLLAQLQSDIPSIEAQFGPIHEQYAILEKYEVTITPGERRQLETLQSAWAALQQTIMEAEKSLQEQKARFKAELAVSVEEFGKNVTSLKEDFRSRGPFQAICGTENSLRIISEYRSQFTQLKTQEASLQKGLAVFRIDQAPSKDIEAITAELNLLEQVWQLNKEWSQEWDMWKNKQFQQLDSLLMEENAQKFQKRAMKLGKEVKEWDVWQSLRDRTSQVRRITPVLNDLKSPAMRDRHWNQLMEEIGKSFDPKSASFTLEKMLDVGLDQYVEAINNIAGAAAKELSVEEGLASIREAWNQLELDIVPYKEDKGYFKLRSTDAIFELLEDNQATLSSMKASKYFLAFEKQVDMWERTLSKVVEVIELLTQVQRQWMYLENIFVGAEDIRKQLPMESAVFDGVNTTYKGIMSRMVKTKNVCKATHEDDLFQTLTTMTASLEKVEKSLDMYLETKRQAFPRFYFLSNDDLLEILGQAKDPNAIQQHLRKCFDNLHKLELATAGTDTRRHVEATGMHSGDGEFVPFYQPVVIEGPVEAWLLDVESAMRETLKKLLIGCIGALRKTKRDKWIKDWAGQLLIVAGQIGWTADCTKSLAETEKGEKNALRMHKKKQVSLLKKLSELVRAPLSKTDRKKLISLITIEVHSRDVIDRMIKTNCQDANAFEWLSQLRFYWDKDEDDCVIRQTNTHFLYGYEYLGNSGRLVITPLTDRCYMTLTTALHLHRGGSPQGPAGTGKTETVKDLGKALGKYVIVQNCSDALDYKSMGRMFSGLVQTGAWGCFDEFNRIDTEVLSVVALQISCILSAIARKAKTFIFEGTEIKLVPTCGIFITMNPGYAGRVELPDNLKSLFRPVSMMVPDTTLIAEIMLFGEGFMNTRVLAKKVDTLYRLSAQQLSKQDHYDFGLRALTSALRTAGLRKRQDFSVPDEVVICVAMRDMNLPKFTAEDVPLFLGILSDLFPGVETAVAENTTLINALTEEMRNQGLQVTQNQVTKTIQLYDTKKTRHGVMVVGATGSGKSVVWRTLQNAMTSLAKSVGDPYNIVKTFVINPKSLGLGELYGEYDLSTNEWTDGVLSSVMRAACSDEKKDEKWVVLDGPVDTLWIESMNTVLDDNKVLTLINGERIALPEQVSLLFEVENLSTASPATVSRCGMIYMDYKDLGWRPYLDSWLQRRADKQAADTLKHLVDKYVQQTLEFKAANCQEFVPVPEPSGIRSLCNVFDAVATVENGVDQTDPESYARMIELWFLFSVIWSLGGSLTDDSRKKFDMFLREIEGQFPSKDTVYEYYVDKQKKAWTPWEEKLPTGWRYSPGTSFYKIMVPTVDTVRNEFILKACISKRTPVLLVGDVGTGKTILIHNVLSSLGENEAVLNVNMSAMTSSERVQSVIESKMEKRTKNIYVPLGGKRLTIYIDDLNMPMKDAFGSQPPLEFLRHWMDYGFCYDRQKQTVKYLTEILLITSMGPPGGGRNPMSPRIQSRFNVINMTFPTEASINHIFGTLINQKLQDFEEEVKPLGDLMTQATIEIYHVTVTQMLPMPAKTHYLFNLRDISRVFQGLLRASREYYDSRESMTKLWLNEVLRVFHDRLVDKEDRDTFTKLLNDKLVAHFNTSLNELCPKTPLFGDFMTENADPATAAYEEIEDVDKLKKYIEEKLQEYNSEPGFIQLDLVLFRDAIEHICRIIRILRQPGGNVLLIGVGGSGRQSLTRLASYLINAAVFQIQVTKHYRHVDFREDLKKVYRMAGIERKQTVFLFVDTQIVVESFLEDFSGIISSGEVPNLFTSDELGEIKEAVRAQAKADKCPDNAEALFAYFIDTVRTNLHCVLCMSPVGDAFRSRLRMFPALVNCTNVDWFSEWPDDALQEVAMKYLEGVDVGSDGVKKAVANVFVTVHTSVVQYSRKMALELKRRNYVTPTSYLELVTGYRQLLKEKRKEVGEAATKLKNGLSKLDDTRNNVERISIELEASKRQVAQFQKECEDYLVVIVQQKREADEQAKVVSARSEKLAVEEEEVRAVADAAQADLDQALPALHAATKALESLNKKDLGEIKSYGKPPALVEKVMEAVMILKKCEPTWDEAKRQLGNPYFIKQLVNFDKENMSDKILKRISQYVADENFNPEIVGRVSGAAKSLCLWVRAIESFGHTFRAVAPKKEKLRSAQDNLEKKQKSLREMKAKLDEVQNKLVELKTQYDEKLALKEKLRAESEETGTKLHRAEQLVSGLSGERARWEKSIKNYEEAMKFLPGDCLLAAACLSYAGPFNSAYRNTMMQNVWLAQIRALELPCSTDFNFSVFLGKPTEIREWNLQGLPSDAYSTENGIIVRRGRRWPLMIDPQGQANNWIKNMEKKRDLKIVNTKQSDFLRTMENAIQYGIPVLLQGIVEELDPALEPILNKSIVKKAGRYVMVLGEKEIEYNPDFRLYLTTKLPNPHYMPEVSAKVALINFSVKEKGLEDQLLGIVVRKEKPELEAQKDELVINVAAARKKLKELEDEILHLLSTATGSLLDDVKLVTALQSSKKIAEEVTQQLLISEQTEAQIDTAREGYRPSAQRASILYFMLNDLSSVDPMYQFSLDSYVDLFDKSISKSKKHDDLNERLTSLNDYHTYSVYKNTCRGLFETHKLLFSFQMCVKILEAVGKINKEEYDFLLRGGQVMDKDSHLPNPCPEWVTESAWDNLTELDNLQGFTSLVSSIEQSERDWRKWFMSAEPEEVPLPGEWENKLNDVQRMLIVRSLRPDRITFCTQNFVIASLGQRFVEPPVLNVADILADSSARIPLIFVLSPGVDPTASLQQLAEKQNMSGRFNYLSLGQGQAPKATKLIQEGIVEGNWVFLANCHLSISWMPALDKIVENLTTQEKPHPDFRLWLSSSPHPKFPISILQNGIKMTTEPPKGLRANMVRLYSKTTEEEFSRCKKPEVYKKLFFCLAFFHSQLIERKKFLTLGWNVACDFNDSDFEVCENLLCVLLDEYQDVPWDALKYLIAEANYGGRVTDDWDRRVLRSYISHLFNDEAIKTPGYPVTSMATYIIPETWDLQAQRDYLNSLPGFDRPEAFGQHPNADIASQIRESNSMLQTLLSLQPQVVSGEGVSREDKVNNMAADILKRIPDDIDYDATAKLVQHDMNPLNVVLLQEIKRYNYLLAIIRKSLEDLRNGIKGIVVMSPDLEDIFSTINDGRVPAMWAKVYASLKPLTAWTRDLFQRVEFFSDWAKGNEPKAFWLGAFTFPTGFLTAVMQRAARKNSVPVDILSWEFTPLQGDEDIKQGPKDGVYIRGIFLEGASWDKKATCLKEPRSMELITPMPTILFKPVEVKKKANKGFYVCPVYYYPIRSGSRERPSFVIAMDLKSGSAEADHWIKRGTACLLNLG